MDRLQLKHVFLVAGVAIFCGAMFAAALLSRRTAVGQAVFAGFLIASLSLVPLGIVWAGKRAEYRFSLRTLLIATTLVAVVLGFLVWAAK